MAKETVITRAWEHGFWFAVLRMRRLPLYTASRKLTFKCAELIGHDQYLLTMERRQPGGKGSM